MPPNHRKQCRAVKDLIHAEGLIGPPPFGASRPPRGSAKSRGLRYQRAVIKALPAGTNPGPWFSYLDANGPGICQPDALVGLDGTLWVVEIKLTYTPEADRQLDLLYLPVVQLALMPRRIRGLVVCQGLTGECSADRVVHTLQDAIGRPETPFPVVHWLGQGKGVALCPK